MTSPAPISQPEPLRFAHAGRSLEVRAFPETNEWIVRVFEGDRRVTNATYSISYTTDFDARFQGKNWATVEALMELARSDVTKKYVTLLP